MDRITRNKIDELAMKVTTFLLKEALGSVNDLSEAKIFSEQQVEALCRRAISETSVEARVRLHAEAWIDDVVSKARKLTAGAADEKVQKATTSAGRGHSPF